MAISKWHLQQKKQRLEREILSNLDFIVGTVTSQGPRGGHSLTTKENGKTRSKYIRNAMLEEVHKMICRHQKLKDLLKELAELNWELLKANHQP